MAFGTFTGLFLFFFFKLQHIEKIEMTDRWLSKNTGWQTEFLNIRAEGTYKTCSMIQLSSELQMIVGRAVFPEPLLSLNIFLMRRHSSSFLPLFPRIKKSSSLPWVAMQRCEISLAPNAFLSRRDYWELS